MLMVGRRLWSRDLPAPLPSPNRIQSPFRWLSLAALRPLTRASWRSRRDVSAGRSLQVTSGHDSMSRPDPRRVPGTGGSCRLYPTGGGAGGGGRDDLQGSVAGPVSPRAVRRLHG